MFTQITDPYHWFLANVIFFALGWILYAVDLHLITQQQTRFKTADEQRLYTDMLKDQKTGLYFLIPLGLLYTALSAWLVKNNPTLFIDQSAHVWLITGQLIFGLISTGKAIKDYSDRVKLINQLAN